MPPKRAASGKAKRKLEESPDPETESSFGTESDAEAEAAEQPKAKGRASKKAKVDPKGAGKAKGKAKATAPNKKEGDGGEGSTSELAPNGQPTNKVVPVHVSFPPREEGRVRIATWNICGLAAAQKKGFKYYVDAEDPDVLILTETKVNNEPVDPALSSRFPHRYWAIADKKTYSGTAILSKIKPISVNTTLPGHPDPAAVKGRIVTLEFASCWLVGTYVVNAGTGLKALDAKKEWNKHFTAYIRSLDRQKPVIWAGDLNVAPTEKGASMSISCGHARADASSTLVVLRTLSRTRLICLDVLCMALSHHSSCSSSALLAGDVVNSIIIGMECGTCSDTWLRVAMDVCW
ncbi:hypothetical protein EVJ58_g7355 [Rhodofomes roseus]|uniref:Endonuclease/exonuclease/phosphatase domain-containing protein n=1 Tax=Rhodofomes roseus TaxID=34475 RepID=A0A4Y9Y4R2_9APHY|nr:hypothetical protein EVJ58_g7355 [Rhodofomes roseus]